MSNIKKKKTLRLISKYSRLKIVTNINCIRGTSDATIYTLSYLTFGAFRVLNIYLSVIQLLILKYTWSYYYAFKHDKLQSIDSDLFLSDIRENVHVQEARTS